MLKNFLILSAVFPPEPVESASISSALAETLSQEGADVEVLCPRPTRPKNFRFKEEIVKTVDIVALPTYYPSEAFPMSIIEAMSYGKLVISTHRAAIPDMLTGLDGENCGILVQEKSVDDIEKAINWCVEHPVEANNLCKKAYQKVKAAYATVVVCDIYRENYQKLI